MPDRAHVVLLLLDIATLTCLVAASLGLWAVLPMLIWSWLMAPVDVGAIVRFAFCMLAATMGLAAVAGELRNRR